MDAAYGVSRFIMDSGERYCLVVDRSTGLPLYYPNLYLTTQLRNRSVAFATIEANASHLVVFLRFLDRRGIHLESRFLSKRFFAGFELDAIRDFTQRKAYKLSTTSVRGSVSSLGGLEESTDTVRTGTQYARLTAIASYLGWLGKHLLDDSEQDVGKKIDAMCGQIKARRPVKRGRDFGRGDRSLSDEQLDILFEVIRPGSELNPFVESVQRRNRLIVLLLFHLGLRAGELLNIRIRDLDFSKNQLRIVRRADEKDDVRIDEPNAKTLGRILPLGDALVKELHDYITKDRRKVSKSSRHDFLIVTHKAGPTCGHPMSKVGYRKLIAVVRAVSPQLYTMSGHMLRHTWNRMFSEKMDSMDLPLGEARQEQLRSFLMGWKEGSGTAATYNRRFIENKGQKASLEMQKSNGTRLPRRLNSDR
ncbi:MAG: site-specific integrase [Ectothiorhodospiraceae bacterium]|nr:site-specific integrase [Ectothiorhodospiraceae bacterium]MCH8503557.1 site-specific integrase [Ectothiorhodospiraceae bacterium]